MPSILHETPLELIRQHPQLVLELLNAVSGMAVLDGATARLVSADASQVVPTQFLADGVVLIEDEGGGPLLAVVIEPQGRASETKHFSWPVYLCSVRKNYGCAAVLLVICWESAEAEKCRQTIYTGHPEFDLTPIVVDPGSPLIKGSDGAAAAAPYLVIFAGYIGAINLDTDQGQEMVLQAASKVEAVADRKACMALILAAASRAARRAMEEKMISVPYRNDFIESFYQDGRVSGRAEGFAEGEARGYVEGAHDADLRGCRALATVVLAALEARGISVTSEHRQRIEDCTDMSELREWSLAALSAETAADVFGG